MAVRVVRPGDEHAQEGGPEQEAGAQVEEVGHGLVEVDQGGGGLQLPRSTKLFLMFQPIKQLHHGQSLYLFLVSHEETDEGRRGNGELQVLRLHGGARGGDESGQLFVQQGDNCDAVTGEEKMSPLKMNFMVE